MNKTGAEVLTPSKHYKNGTEVPAPEGYKQTKVGVIPEDWEKYELKELINISSKKFSPKTSKEEKKCIELEHLSQKTGQLLGYISSKEQQSTKNIFNKGQILYGKLRPYLKKYWKAEFNGVCSSEIWVLNGNKIINEYLFFLVQTNKFNQIANVSSGSKMPRADWKYMAEIPFIIPPLKEQEKIAQILTTWDDAITKQEDLIKAKETLKKGLMQKLLSGEWEEVRLGNIGKTYGGLTKKTAEDFAAGDAQYITYKNIFDNNKIDISIFDNVKINNDEKQNKVMYGDVLFTTSSETPEEVGMSSVLLDEIDELYLNSFCFGYRLNDLNILNPQFARFYFRSFYMRDKISRLAQGSTRFNLSKLQVMKIKIKLPPMEEQEKIAHVLTLSDKEIELLKEELETLKEQKRGLMQRLLNGVVSVKL